MREKKFSKILSLVLIAAIIMSAVVVGVVVASAEDYSGYCLFGYIGGQDVGSTGTDWDKPTPYVFSADGTITTTLAADPASGNAYVAVKTLNGSDFYMFTEYVMPGDEASGVLYHCDQPPMPSEKMGVPGDTEVTFTLSSNGDGTFTLSYKTGSEPTQEPTTVAPTTVAPTTVAPTTASSDKLSLKADGKDYSFNVGDKFTYTYYMNVNDQTEGAGKGKIQNIDANLPFDSSKLKIGDIDDEKVFPIIGGDVMSNIADSTLYFNASKLKGYTFNNDECVLVTVDFEVIAGGETSLDTRIKDMADLNDNRFVQDYNIKNQWDYSVEIDGGEQPTTVEPTTAEPTTVEPTTVAPTTVAPGGTYVKVNGTNYPVKVGDKITFTTYMNVTDATKGNTFTDAQGNVKNTEGMIQNIDAFTSYTGSMLKLIPQYDEEEEYEPAMFPILNKRGGLINNISLPNEVTFNATTEKGYTFNSDDSVLCQYVFEVIAEGQGEIATNFKTMCPLVNDLSNRIVDNGEIKIPFTHVDTLETPEPPTPTTVEPTTAEPTTAEPTTAEPTTAEPTTAEPTTAEPTTVEPTTAQPTTAEPTYPAGLYIKADGKLYAVEQGQTYTYAYFLKVAEKVEAFDATTYYDVNGLEWTPVLDEDEEIDETALYPVAKGAGMITNYNVDGQIIYNGSNIKGYKFSTDDAKLIETKFKVTASEGVYEINTMLKTLADINDHKYVFNGEVVDDNFVRKGEILDAPEPTTVEPTTAEPTTAEPTTAEPTTAEPTTAEPTTAEPTTAEPTTAEPTVPGSDVYLKVDGVLYPVEQGQTYTYSYYLNVPEKVEAFDATTFYDVNGVKWTPILDEDGEVDEEALYPVAKGTGMITNYNVDGQIIYNGSNIKGYKFTTEDAKLITTKFLVTADKGVYEIRTAVKTLADINDHKYVFNGEIVDDNFKTREVIEDVTPVPTRPTEPTAPTEPTEPTEPTAPTEPTEPTAPTEPTEPTTVAPTTVAPTTVEPTTVPETTVEPSSTEAASSTAAPATTPGSSTNNNNNTGGGSSVKTGSTTFAFAFLMMLVLAAGVVMYARRRKED